MTISTDASVLVGVRRKNVLGCICGGFKINGQQSKLRTSSYLNAVTVEAIIAFHLNYKTSPEQGGCCMGA